MDRCEYCQGRGLHVVATEMGGQGGPDDDRYYGLATIAWEYCECPLGREMAGDTETPGVGHEGSDVTGWIPVLTFVREGDDSR